jgi:Zn-dependent protease with chaperone function
VARSAAAHRGASAAAAARDLADLAVPVVFLAMGWGARLGGPSAAGSWFTGVLVVLAALEAGSLPHRFVLDALLERRWWDRPELPSPAAAVAGRPAGSFAALFLVPFTASFVALAVVRFVLVAALAVVGLAVVRSTAWWPFAVWASFVGAGVVWETLHPVLVSPRVDGARPLERPEVQARISVLTTRAHVAGVRVDVAPGLDRPEGAHLAGVGPTRRLVVAAALVDGPPGDLDVVVAHELGHWRLGHDRQGLRDGALIAALVVTFTWLIGRWSGTDLGEPASLPLWLVCLAGFGLLGDLVSARRSRRQELEADRFAAALVGWPEVVDQLRRHHQAVDADLQPGRWARLRSSHPAAAQRLASLASSRPAP